MNKESARSRIVINRPISSSEIKTNYNDTVKNRALRDFDARANDPLEHRRESPRPTPVTQQAVARAKYSGRLRRLGVAADRTRDKLPDHTDFELARSKKARSSFSRSLMDKVNTRVKGSAPQKEGLSTGQKIGVGVGATGAVVGAIALRKYLKKRKAKKEAERE